MYFLTDLAKEQRCVAQVFLFLPDGCGDGGAATVKAVDDPLDAATEVPFLQRQLLRRLTSLVARDMEALHGPYAELITLVHKMRETISAVDEPSELPDDAEPLAVTDDGGVIQHPRHVHPLEWRNVREMAAYAAGGYICNVCSLNPRGSYCYHCDACTFDLCAGCALVGVGQAQDGLRLRRGAYHILSYGGETIPAVMEVLRQPLCTRALAERLIALVGLGVKESAALDGFRAHQLHCVPAVAGAPAPSWPSAIQQVEAALIAWAAACVAEVRMRHRQFKEEVQRAVAAAGERDARRHRAAATATSTATEGAAAEGPLSPPPSSAAAVSAFGIALPDGFTFGADAVVGMLCRLQLQESMNGHVSGLLGPYAESGRAECRELNMLWHAAQTYLQDITLILQHSPKEVEVPLPPSVLVLLESFCRYHLSDARRDGVSASASTLSSERAASLRGETESFLTTTTTTRPSPTSEEAWQVVVADREEVGTTSAMPGVQDDKAAEGTRRRLPRLVRRFLEANRATLNALLAWQPTLLRDKFPFLRSEPSLIDFTFKLDDFRSRIVTNSGVRFTLHVDRHRCLEDSFQELKKLRAFNGPMQVRFKGEEGADAGGLTREWFQLMAKALVNESYALFIHSREGLTYQPNPFSDVNAAHLEYFRVAGIVVGLAMAHNVAIDMHFTRCVYRHMVGVEPVFQDLESVDPELYSSLRWLRENDASDLCLTFAVNYERFGDVKEEELIPGGREIAVTEENKLQYIRHLCQFHMTSRIHSQLVSFLSGFYAVIPRSAISAFSEQELELVICGMPDVDIEDLRAHTSYEGYTANSLQVRWFWEAVQGMTREDLANLLQFTTGASKVPQGGFANLEGSNGHRQPFTLSRWEGGSERLPQAHTCFNKIDLPEYASAEALREKLMLAITFGSMGFTMV